MNIFNEAIYHMPFCFLASVHKCLRICDLLQGIGVWDSNAQRVKSQFIQLVRVQRVVPPVPGEFPRTPAVSFCGKKRC